MVRFPRNGVSTDRFSQAHEDRLQARLGLPVQEDSGKIDNRNRHHEEYGKKNVSLLRSQF
jgi:hypothetical protein